MNEANESSSLSDLSAAEIGESKSTRAAVDAADANSSHESSELEVGGGGGGGGGSHTGATESSDEESDPDVVLDCKVPPPPPRSAGKSRKRKAVKRFVPEVSSETLDSGEDDDSAADENKKQKKGARKIGAKAARKRHKGSVSVDSIAADVNPWHGTIESDLPGRDSFVVYFTPAGTPAKRLVAGEERSSRAMYGSVCMRAIVYKDADFATKAGFASDVVDMGDSNAHVCAEPCFMVDKTRQQRTELRRSVRDDADIKHVRANVTARLQAKLCGARGELDFLCSPFLCFAVRVRLETDAFGWDGWPAASVPPCAPVRLGDKFEKAMRKNGVPLSQSELVRHSVGSHKHSTVCTAGVPASETCVLALSFVQLERVVYDVSIKPTACPIFVNAGVATTEKSGALVRYESTLDRFVHDKSAPAPRQSRARIGSYSAFGPLSYAKLARLVEQQAELHQHRVRQATMSAVAPTQPRCHVWTLRDSLHRSVLANDAIVRTNNVRDAQAIKSARDLLSAQHRVLKPHSAELALAALAHPPATWQLASLTDMSTATRAVRCGWAARADQLITSGRAYQLMADARLFAIDVKQLPNGAGAVRAAIQQRYGRLVTRAACDLAMHGTSGAKPSSAATRRLGPTGRIGRDSLGHTTADRREAMLVVAQAVVSRGGAMQSQSVSELVESMFWPRDVNASTALLRTERGARQILPIVESVALLTMAGADTSLNLASIEPVPASFSFDNHVRNRIIDMHDAASETGSLHRLCVAVPSEKRADELSELVRRLDRMPSKHKVIVNVMSVEAWIKCLSVPKNTVPAGTRLFVTRVDAASAPQLMRLLVLFQWREEVARRSMLGAENTFALIDMSRRAVGKAPATKFNADVDVVLSGVVGASLSSECNFFDELCVMARAQRRAGLVDETFMRVETLDELIGRAGANISFIELPSDVDSALVEQLRSSAPVVVLGNAASGSHAAALARAARKSSITPASVTGEQLPRGALAHACRQRPDSVLVLVGNESCPTWTRRDDAGDDLDDLNDELGSAHGVAGEGIGLNDWVEIVHQLPKTTRLIVACPEASLRRELGAWLAFDRRLLCMRSAWRDCLTVPQFVRASNEQ